MQIAEDTAAAATSDVPYAKERVAMMLTILKRFMVQAGASGKYLYNTPSNRIVNTIYPRIVLAETILFGKCKM